MLHIIGVCVTEPHLVEYTELLHTFIPPCLPTLWHYAIPTYCYIFSVSFLRWFNTKQEFLNFFIFCPGFNKCRSWIVAALNEKPHKISWWNNIVALMFDRANTVMPPRLPQCNNACYYCNPPEPEQNTPFKNPRSATVVWWKILTVLLYRMSGELCVPLDNIDNARDLSDTDGMQQYGHCLSIIGKLGA